jgi:maltooligosyltrehalose trehalohydrolase
MRKFAQGAEMTADGVSFRVWAPDHRRVEVVLSKARETRPLEKEQDGYWSAVVEGVRAGDQYRYRLNGASPDLPDPAARFLPEGPHGPAEIVDPNTFTWSDDNWTGHPSAGHVIYELHVGTFSPEGNWEGALAKLPLLRDLGITTIEIMPVAEFAGRYGWGYDGVAWFAPSHLYGSPDSFRRFVNGAHALGLAVILDVVYNHFGPSGDYSSQYSRNYVGATKTEWGGGLNYDGTNAHGMRQLATDNAAYWIDEFHLDGLRLDATQAIRDTSPDHIVSAISRAARTAAKGRRLFLVGESEPQDSRLLHGLPQPGSGSGLDALWNDDFHHSSVVALTGRRQAYYSDYVGNANEWIATAKQGFLYQGQRSFWQKGPRGRPTRGLPMEAFVSFLENHDQVANSLWGERLWRQCRPSQHRAMTALLLLGPWTPMLFQGQEWNSSARFCYFAGHDDELAGLVRKGRTEFLSQFPGCANHPELLPDPGAPEVLQDSRLRWDERTLMEHAQALKLHQDLLRIRRSDWTIGRKSPEEVTIEIAALSPHCGLLRYFAHKNDPQRSDRILLTNLGSDFELTPGSQPLLAPPDEFRGSRWRASWSSEDPGYGGYGCSEPDTHDSGWVIPASATLLLAPGQH